MKIASSNASNGRKTTFKFKTATIPNEKKDFSRNEQKRTWTTNMILFLPSSTTCYAVETKINSIAEFE